MICDYGDPQCTEAADETCFDCDDPICEAHAQLIPGHTNLYVCPACFAKRIVRRIRAAVESDTGKVEAA